MKSKGVEDHDGAEDEDRVHCTVFEVGVLFYFLDVAHSELS